jgi:hypothetical protein
MFCGAKRDIFACGKCDIAAAQLRYDINPLTPRRAYHIEDISHRLSGISQIPPGIYIAANKKLPSEEGSFIVSN